uniref:hypothetical protein n=1 Tax=Azospirillum tabaci TaxID=2752310 RepID=UPI0016605DC9
AAWLDGADAFECGFKDLDAATDGLQPGAPASGEQEDGAGAKAAGGDAPPSLHKSIALAQLDVLRLRA